MINYMKILQGLRVGPGSATKRWPSRKNAQKSLKKNLSKKICFLCINLLVMPKYWGKQIFTHGRFPEVGQKQKTEKKKRRANDGNNNGQLRIVTPPGPKPFMSCVYKKSAKLKSCDCTAGAKTKTKINLSLVLSHVLLFDCF